MAKIGAISLAVEIPEFTVVDFNTGELNLVFDTPIPVDGSVLLAMIVVGGDVTFDSGQQRHLVFFSGNGNGRLPIHFDSVSYDAKVDEAETWGWVSVLSA